jgi:excisionase family DNA binding protein
MAELRTRPQRKQELRLYDIGEVASLLGGCSKMHVYRLITAGELRAVDIANPGAGRSKTRVRSDDLADYIERKTRGGRKGAAPAIA